MSLKDDLYKLYWEDGLSQKEIGEIYGKPQTWIFYQMNKYKIPARNTKDIKIRFLYYVKIPENSDDCWEWIGNKNRDGYGRFNFNNKLVQAHRVSCVLFRGEFDQTLDCLHKCDNPSYVNPDHLFLGNHKDNMNDMKQKGRDRPAKGEQLPQSKLIEEEVKEIKLLLSQGISCGKIGKIFKIHKRTISYIKQGKTWKHIKEI